MSGSRKSWIAVAATLALVALALFAAPVAVLAHVEKVFAHDGCPAADAAPTDRYFRAHELTDLVAQLPWYRHRAQAVSTSSAMICMDAFAVGCDAIRDDAIGSAQRLLEYRLGIESDESTEPPNVRPNGPITWQEQVEGRDRDAFCEDWRSWIDWLGEQQLDGYAVCPVCGTT